MRLGRIHITKEVLKDPQTMSVLLSLVSVRNLNFSYEYNCYVLFGESEKFDEVKEGELIPRYDVRMKYSGKDILIDETEFIKC